MHCIRMAALVVAAALVSACGEGSGTTEASKDQVIDNSPAPGAPAENSLAPTDRDPTPDTGTGGPSQSTSPTGTEKTGP